MSEINYQALREAAEKATWGDWDSYKPHRGARGYEVRLSSQAIAKHVLKNNAEFIAAFNPKVALALLDERERNQQYIKSRDQENEDIALTVGKLRVELEAAEKRLAELQSKSMRPVAWMRSDDITTFGPIFTKNENYAVEQWGDNAVALYASPVNFKLACFTDERNLKYINERGRETSLIWSERNSESGDVQLFRATGIRIKGE
ncbi:TPA: ead/Ea22-like family protein [Escherichia coli]|nr:ead/Ea22-like family protein [Escherichia coli]